MKHSICKSCARGITVKEELDDSVTYCRLKLVKPNSTVEKCSSFLNNCLHQFFDVYWEKDGNTWSKVKNGDVIDTWPKVRKRKRPTKNIGSQVVN